MLYKYIIHANNLTFIYKGKSKVMILVIKELAQKKLQ